MHDHWMRIAIEEAQKGMGCTSPNPMVGAIIVRDDRLLGKGYHAKAGEPHAERMALADVLQNHGPQATQGATIYVTLEPCSTTGKTPPCTEGIIEAGITTVVWGSMDPNPDHQGAAKKILEKEGIEVITGVLEEECDLCIRAFSKRILTGMPWVIAKTAMSLDGKITRPPRESQWLTSPQSREVVHQLRAKVDAIIIGGRTLRKDNPRLTLRGDSRPAAKVQPYRAIITHSNKRELPQGLHVFTDEYKDRTLIFHDVPFKDILLDLAERGCNSVLLECGGGLMGQWFDQKLVNECHFFIAPIVTGGGDLAVAGEGVSSNEEAIKLHQLSYQKIGDDMLARGLVGELSGRR